MDPHRSMEAEERLAGLRRAVYGPDSTPEAVEAYAVALAALTALPPAPVADRPRPVTAGRLPAAPPTHRHHRWVVVGAACGVGAALVLGSVLAARTAPAAPAAPPSSTDTTPVRIEPPPVPGPVLATFTSTSGAVGVQLDAQGQHVFLAAECGGSGTVTIRLSDGSETVLTCGAGLPPLVLAESPKPLHRFTCTITTTERPVWALTVGVVLTAAE
ncbi:MAG TPA: hypothetical protein VGO26_02545 [Amnibacterium sp.]|nr:hypothetical protein [Amnibacterium sp.]